MTLEELKDVLLTIDPALKKDHWNSSGDNYTIYTPHHWEAMLSDDGTDEETIQVTIDRFTNDDKDQVIYRIQSALEANYVTMNDLIRVTDEETGYIRFILECFVTP